MSKNNETTVISVRLSIQEKELLQKVAEENDMSMSQIVRKAIKQYLLSE